MASDTSTSSSDLSEHSDEPILSEEDAENEEKTLDLRQKRSKKPPARYFDAFQTDEDKLEVEMIDSKIRVKCNQTGKLFSVKVTTLCREDGDPLGKEDLVEGAQLVMTLNKKPYSVTFQETISPLGSQTKNTKSKPLKRPSEKKLLPDAKKRKLANKENALPVDKGDLQPSKKRGMNKENLLAAKTEFLKSSKVLETEGQEADDQDVGHRDETSTSGEKGQGMTDRELLLRIEAKVDSLTKLGSRVDNLIHLLQGRDDPHTGFGKIAVKEEEQEFVVDGINLLRVPAKDVNAYGRALLDLLFTKQEQKTSIVMKSKKSSKPPLDQSRVEKMFACIRRRYGNSYSHSELMSTLNQKCRDAKPDS